MLTHSSRKFGIEHWNSRLYKVRGLFCRSIYTQIKRNSLSSSTKGFCRQAHKRPCCSHRGAGNSRNLVHWVVKSIEISWNLRPEIRNLLGNQSRNQKTNPTHAPKLVLEIYRNLWNHSEIYNIEIRKLYWNQKSIYWNQKSIYWNQKSVGKSWLWKEIMMFWGLWE